MNRHFLLSACLLGLGASAILLAQDIKLPGQSAPAATAPAPAAAPAPKFTDQQILEAFGWYVGKRIGLADFEFSPAELATVMQGLQSAVAGRDAPVNMEQIGPQMDAFIQGKQTRAMDRMRKAGTAETAAYFARLKENKNVVSLPSGLCYEIVQPGKGDYPKAADTVKVHYTGRLVNGTVFDSSVSHGEPVEFPLNGVIPGWTEGLQKINQGGKIRLHVPPPLAYGEDGQGPIPPASTLVFDVELLEVKAPIKPVTLPAPIPAK